MGKEEKEKVNQKSPCGFAADSDMMMNIVLERKKRRSEGHPGQTEQTRPRRVQYAKQSRRREGDKRTLASWANNEKVN